MVAGGAQALLRQIEGIGSLQFLSLAVGTALSGTFAGYYDAGDAGAERTYFLVIGAAAILGGLVMVALRRGILTAFEGVQ